MCLDVLNSSVCVCVCMRACKKKQICELIPLIPLPTILIYMLRCLNIKKVKLQNVRFLAQLKLFWKQLNKQQATQRCGGNISHVRSSEHREIKCLFGLSKGTVPSHWQTHPYSWGFFRGKKRDTNLNIEMKITNAWDFLILPPTTPALLLSFSPPA